MLDFFWRRKRHYYPLVYTLFFTGLRTGEAVGLRWGAVNLRRSTLSVRVSRTLGEDNPPKTRRARARSRCAPMWWPCSGQSSRSGAREDTFVFTSEAGNALDEERFVDNHWRPALRATGVKARKFYATRHTFISQTLEAGVVKLKALADYCGTSMEMIERHYAGWMPPTQPAELAALGGTAPAPIRVVGVA